MFGFEASIQGRNPFTIELNQMKQERLIRGQAALRFDEIGQVQLVAAPDAEVVRQIATGSQEAFAVLWDRFGPGIYTVCYLRLSDIGLAEDATQEAFISIWRRAATFDPRRGSAAGWLYAIARNAAAQLARRARTNRHLTVLHTETAEEEDDPVLALALHAALTRLPPSEREVLELAYFEDMTQRTIAARLQLPLGTVKTRTRAGLQRLARYLEETEE